MTDTKVVHCDVTNLYTYYIKVTRGSLPLILPSIIYIVHLYHQIYPDRISATSLIRPPRPIRIAAYHTCPTPSASSGSREQPPTPHQRAFAAHRDARDPQQSPPSLERLRCSSAPVRVPPIHLGSCWGYFSQPKVLKEKTSSAK